MNYKEIFENTYKGKKVLLTGHTGFKGSWMLAWLHQLGAEVKGYALKPENENDLYCQVGGDKLCDSTIADIRDKEKLSEVISGFQPDFIFHLAAQPLVRRSYELPLYTFEVNVNGTVHLLEAVRDLQKPCTVVIITTDKVYENKETDYAYKETDKLGGHDPYSASKAAAEIVVSSYRNSFFNAHDFHKHKKTIATARAGNVIGGGDWAKDRIVPDIVRALQTGQPVVVRNPGAIRPWQHVLEPLSGYLLLGAKLAEDPGVYANAWNFGPREGDIANVENIVKEILQLWGSGSYSLQTKPGEMHEANLLRLDISNSINILKWEPRLDINECLAMVVQGYTELAAGNNNFIFQQIEKYVNQ